MKPTFLLIFALLIGSLIMGLLVMGIGIWLQSKLEILLAKYVDRDASEYIGMAIVAVALCACMAGYIVWSINHYGH